MTSRLSAASKEWGSLSVDDKEVRSLLCLVNP